MSLTVRADEHPHQNYFLGHITHTTPFSLCPAEVELSCLIESISTTNPRIEWKKITNDGPSYVYFGKKISGNVSSLMSVCFVQLMHFNTEVVVFISTGGLENRAVIREPATLLITNATRSDTAKYRCEVTAADDQKSFDELVIDLVVRGMLSCSHLCFRPVLHVGSKVKPLLMSLK